MNELNEVNIRHFKLVSGEDIIAIVLTEEDVGSENYNHDIITVQRPMEIKMVNTDTGTSFVFYEWQPLAKTDICFVNPFHVISHVECDDDIKGEYINACVNESPSDESDTLPAIGLPSSQTYH